MNVCSLTAGVTALANALAGTLTCDQLTMAAALFTQLGDTLAYRRRTGDMPGAMPIKQHQREVIRASRWCCLKTKRLTSRIQADIMGTEKGVAGVSTIA